MLRVLDGWPGSHAAARRGDLVLLRMCAHVRASADAAELTGLRVLLVADVLARAAELAGLQVLTAREFTGAPAARAVVESAATALGIHPPAPSAAGAGGAWPDGPADVHVADDSTASPGDHDGVLIGVADARLVRDAGSGDPAGLPGGPDLLAVRFALMSFPRHKAAGLSAARLAGAAETLAQWRSQVARWAQSPSRAVPERIAATLREAFGDLDTAAVLALLSGLAADETVPAGARFEAFVFADRVLGLDLPSGIGR